jgi:putative intracellular protease/amidase
VKQINVILFDGFETLDVFGPVEIFGRMNHQYTMDYFSMQGELVTSSQGVQVKTKPISKIQLNEILLIPGGEGTRTLIDNEELIKEITLLAAEAEFVLTICTGAALLAKTGIINGKKATTNKRAFSWVQSVNEKVAWQKQARWVVDDKFYTSSGVSAGMDMSLGFIKDQQGQAAAEGVAEAIEYIWNKQADNDPFCDRAR